ncbi:MAG: hypothetical protein ACOVP1_00690 [Bacteroidia bacterium]
MKLRLLLLQLLSLVLLNPTFAQEEEGALQVKLEKEQSSYTVYPVGNNGFLLGSHDDGNKKSNQYIFEKYDADLKKNKTYKANLVKNQSICFTKFVEGKYFYMIAGIDLNYGENSACKEFTVYRIDLNNMDAKTINISCKKPFHIRDLNVINNQVLLSGVYAASSKDLQRRVCYSALLCYIPMFFYKPEGHPVLYKLDFDKRTGNKKEIEFPNSTKVFTNILSVDYADSLGNVDLLLYTYAKKINKISIKTVVNDKGGKDIDLKFPQNKTAVSGKIFSKSLTDKYVAGIVGDSKRSNGVKGTFAVTSGMFLASVKNSKLVFNKTNNFSEFKNFKFLSKRGQKLAEKRAKKQKDLDVSVTSITHHIVERENSILVMGEAFFPTWRTETYTTFENGRMVTRTRTVFDGYEWLGGFVIAYDLNGKMIWENGMKLNQTIKSYYANKRLIFAENENGDIEITCALYDKVQTKTIHEDGKADEDKFVNIKIADGGKKVSKKRDATLGSNIEPWYDNFYLAYNFQKIQKDKKEKGDKFSYYLNVNKINMTEE